ncbi:hypothetical protein BJX68DRAFT_259156 [Aspergillus pseudodeflectus]|uniref:Uncharacterized protein n=1 Tax=Aspergillus pseudodeflectus TaxID=176178 RepID=A0ABR4JF62_9EURO
MAVSNIAHAILASILLSLATTRALLSTRTFRQRPLYRCVDITSSVALVAFLVAVVALRAEIITSITGFFPPVLEFVRLQFILSDMPLFAARVKIFYAFLCALHTTKVTVVFVSYLAYAPVGNALPILSAVDYIGVATGYLCLAQQTVRDSQSERRLVRAVYGMFGFSGLLATIAAIGVSCRAGSLPQEVQLLLTIALSIRHGWGARRYSGRRWSG